MNNAQEDLEKQMTELRAEVAKFRQTMLYGFIGLGVILLVGLCAPWLGALAIGLAILVVIIVTVSAALGSMAGKAVNKARAGKRP